MCGGAKAVEQISCLITNLKVEDLCTVLGKGQPQGDTFSAYDIALNLNVIHTTFCIINVSLIVHYSYSDGRTSTETPIY